MGKTGRHWGSDLNQQGHFSQPLFVYDFFLTRLAETFMAII